MAVRGQPKRQQHAAIKQISKEGGARGWWWEKVENTRKYEKISARNKKLFIKDCNANEKINSTD